MNESKQLLTAAEVAETLGVGQRSIFRWRDMGSICPPVKVAGSAALRWRKTDILEWITAGTPDCARTGFRPSTDAAKGGGR
ncbi:MAG: helix-turn-helix domain-containing protein [Candidatus Hydrogenedentes bacterium]|nr:helix-turn-helix domain-containing protein [Candidatus Hydrogenedentota bacterium]